MDTTTKQDDSVDATQPISFDLPSVEATTQQVRDLNERLVAASKSATLTALDTFDRAFQGVGDLEQKAASATHVDWISQAATHHAKLISDASTSYTSAVRDLLK